MITERLVAPMLTDKSIGNRRWELFRLGTLVFAFGVHYSRDEQSCCWFVSIDDSVDSWIKEFDCPREYVRLILSGSIDIVWLVLRLHMDLPLPWPPPKPGPGWWWDRYRWRRKIKGNRPRRPPRKKR